ncbi:hypothetical protein P43SY_009986 [Pythium insidiosum]|uniref:DUF7920 domain-containing protein n=1 Tax=Pythium insidiosum TaxID=114742 RepID=A0AAD5LH95_PYTIN|nr:hypothetical protein P43SY_009986 [Pythium insidiosum]
MAKSRRHKKSSSAAPSASSPSPSSSAPCSSSSAASSPHETEASPRQLVLHADTLGLAPPHAAFTDSVRSVLDTVEACVADELSVHVRKGREQLEAFMRREHADADADGQAFTSFEAMVATQSARWKEHVEFAKKQSKEMRVNHRFVQPSLRLAMQCTDLKVGRPGRPDDSVYKRSEYARRFMPRGNFVAEWLSPVTQETYFFPVVRAYRKFTGQEDDAEEAKDEMDEDTLSKYFTRPRSATQHVISTTKENGEAAHLAVLQRSDGAYLFAVGSKNTHMIVSSVEDIAAACAVGRQNGNDPYAAAEPIARAMLRTIDALSPENRETLCAFLAQTRATASFEMLCPSYQHVQLLDYIEQDTPVFYGLSLPTMEAPQGAEICVNPVLAYELMRSLGFRTVEYKVVPFEPTAYAARLQEIRDAWQHEGAVNLFVDDAAHVIGMEKFKTTWYVCLRAIREKAKSFLHHALSTKKTAPNENEDAVAASLETALQQLHKRFRAIKVYLALNDEVCSEYHSLGERFVQYLHDERLTACGDDAAAKQELKQRVATLFPVVWKEFLTHTGASDEIR